MSRREGSCVYGFGDRDGLLAFFEEGGYFGEERPEGRGWEFGGHFVRCGGEGVVLQRSWDSDR